MSYVLPSLFGVFLLGSFLSGLLQRPNPFKDRKVAEHQVVSSDWTKIKLDQPLKSVGDYQQIGLVLAPPLELDLLGASGSSSRERLTNSARGGIAHSRRCHDADEVFWLTRETTLTYCLKDESVKQDYNRI